MIQITIAAVGDLLMKSEIIASAKQADGYEFDPIFENVKPYLKKYDVTIGNLETTFSGKRRLGVAGSRPKCNCPRERRNPRTCYPVFNCPDELASTLKNTGFHVLTTANNHCMDGGVTGLKRTLNVLDKNGLKHTGTFRSPRRIQSASDFTSEGCEYWNFELYQNDKFHPRTETVVCQQNRSKEDRSGYPQIEK